MPRRPVATPETDPQLAEIVRLRTEEQLNFTEIALRVGFPERPLSGNAASQRFYRWASANGIKTEPFRGRGQAAYVRLGEPPVHAPAPRETEPLPAAGTPGVATLDQSGVAQRVIVKAERKAGWQQSILVTADHHHDSIHSDRELLAHHLNQARAAKAGVVIIGDLFCAMQGRMDKRGGKADLRPEYQVDHYTDALVDKAAEWYEPYADLIWMASYGNHESKFQQIHETDVLGRWVREMNRHAGGSILLGAYAGFLAVECDFGDGTSQLIRNRYHHGWGGGGPVTLGAIGTNRQAASADYDAYWQGHIHEKWVIYRTRETLDASGTHVIRDVPHLCAGPYKSEGSQGQGWHVETGKPQKPMGGWWQDMYWSERQQCVMLRIRDVDQ